MNNMQKKLYKWQRDELTVRENFPSCEYPADLKSRMALLPEEIEFD